MPAIDKGGASRSAIFDTADVIAWRITRELAEAAGVNPDEVFDYQVERGRLTKNQADREELRVQQLTGELVPSRAAIEVTKAQTIAARTKLLGMGPKLKSRFDLPDGMLDALDNLVREALQELSEARLPQELAEALGRDGSGVEAAAEVDP